MPTLTGVLETSLYVDELDRASRFYEEIFGLTCIHSDIGFTRTVLAAAACFSFLSAVRPIASFPCRKETWARTTAAARCIWHFPFPPKICRPGKDCLLTAELPSRLASSGHAAAPASIFVDPDNHSVELATCGVWSIY